MAIMRNMAIKHKLVSIIMLTCVAALLLAGAVFVLTEWIALRRDILQDISTHAAMAADNCKAALAFQDVDDAEKTLSTLKEKQSIVRGCIRDRDGEVFADYNRDSKGDLAGEDYAEPTFDPGKGGHSFDDGYLTVCKPVILDDEVIGTVCLRSDLQPMHSMLRAKAVTITGVVLLASLGAYVVSSRLQRIISSPILKLAEVAKAVSHEKDYSVRAAKESNDEVGLLIDSFNEMLDQIHHHELALVEANESLEARVKERTVELTAANRQLQYSVERANLMAREAQAASEAKSQFLATMSHEIRTPMNGIIGFAEILADEELAAECKEYVTIIRDCGRELLVLINDILDFSKIEANKLATEITNCSLAKLLDSIESLMGPKAVEKGLELRFVESPGLPGEICTDPARVRQCLVNLVENALKFTERGHVQVTVSMHEENRRGCIQFDVEDTGIGIPKDKQDAVFEVFTQADGSHTRKYGGSGLGLSITKRLAEILGGRVTVTSIEHEGSTFSLILPLGVDVKKGGFLERHNLGQELQTDRDKFAEAAFSGRVLVAEDSITNQRLIELLLKRVGLDVTIVEDGNEAVEKAQSMDFDLILMDMQMPNLNGYEATKKLRREGITTPIIALTANAMKGDDRKCLAAGCDDYLSKPIDRAILLETIARYLKARETVVCEESSAEA